MHVSSHGLQLIDCIQKEQFKAKRPQ